MADNDDRNMLERLQATAQERQEARVQQVQLQGGFSKKQAEWLVERDLDLPRSRFSPSDTPIGPGSGYDS